MVAPVFRFPACLLAWVVLLAGVVALLVPRDARAQPPPVESTIYVPPRGLVFRTLDGKAVARLSYGPDGAVLELFDAGERTGGRLSSLTLDALTKEWIDHAHDDEEDPYCSRF